MAAPKSSFQKRVKSKILQIPGCRPSLHNNQLLVSTGVPSLDTVIGEYDSQVTKHCNCISGRRRCILSGDTSCILLVGTLHQWKGCSLKCNIIRFFYGSSLQQKCFEFWSYPMNRKLQHGKITAMNKFLFQV